MRSLVQSPVFTRIRRCIGNGEGLALLAAVFLIELMGQRSTDDVDDVPLVIMLPFLFVAGCSVVGYKDLPLTNGVLEAAMRLVNGVRARLVLSLGLDFHPERHPRLPAFTTLRRAVLV